MTLTAFILIFASLLLHSLWHFLCKSSGKSSMSFFALFSTSILLVILPMGLMSGLLFKLPLDILQYAFLGAFFGVICDVGLMMAYRNCDISMAYPMARALPVFFTMLVTSLFHWGKALSVWSVTGMIIIFAGCMCMTFTNSSNGLSLMEKLKSIRKGLIGILIAAAGTTGYTVADGFGIKKIMEFAPEGSNALLTAAAYSTCRESFASAMLWLIVPCCIYCGKEKGLLKNLVRTYHPFTAGVAAGLAYLLVLVAMNHVSNVSFVQAFRQLSLPVGALLGFIILKEKISALRLTALAVIMLGLIISVI